MIIIKSKTPIKKNNNLTEYKYHIQCNDKDYTLFWKDHELPIIYDYKYDNEMSKFNWYVLQNGYVVSSNDTDTIYMHKFIAKLARIKEYDNDELTADHINWNKLDNRVKNLRMVIQEQRNNKTFRSDKKPPCQELIDAGVTELPKHIRWDNSEKKFIIDKHPHLINEVTQGIRSKPMMSGSKSVKLTIIQKYQDILSRLKNLDDLVILRQMNSGTP